MGDNSIDGQQTTQWAIASVSSKGALGLTATTFDLVNRHTGRAHRLIVKSGGIDVGSPLTYSPHSSMSGYADFTTYKAVDFSAFDGVGARLISGGLLVYSWISLTLWDGPAYISAGLAWARMSGWGISLPGAGFDHGIANVTYGSGIPLGTPTTVPDVEIDMKELLDYKIQISAKEERIVFVIPDNLFFDFDQDALKSGSDKILAKTASAIATIKNRRKVYFNGYTDALGKDKYNLDLSNRRAKTVAGWFVSSGLLPPEQVEAVPHGAADPVAPNKSPRGADNPAGRALNRRVEIVVIRG
jgi:outer membrane protein OmpA-like peptidoglycan-associated protein